MWWFPTVISLYDYEKSQPIKDKKMNYTQEASFVLQPYPKPIQDKKMSYFSTTTKMNLTRQEIYNCKYDFHINRSLMWVVKYQIWTLLINLSSVLSKVYITCRLSV